IEMAIVRLCRMEELLSVGQLVQSIGQNGVPLPQSGQKSTSNGSSSHVRTQTLSGNSTGSTSEVKKNGLMGRGNDSESHANENGASPISLSPSTLESIWGRLLRYISDKSPLLANQLKFANLP